MKFEVEPFEGMTKEQEKELKEIAKVFENFSEQFEQSYFVVPPPQEIKEYLEKMACDFLYFIKELTEITEEERKKKLDILKETAQINEMANRATKGNTLKQNYKPPQNFIQLATKAQDVFFSGTHKQGVQQIFVGWKRKEKVHVFADFDIEQDDIEYINVLDENNTPPALNRYDREVFNGICSILETGQTVMTATQIYEVMTGKKLKNKQVTKSIDNSILKMQKEPIWLDYTAHSKMNKAEIQMPVREMFLYALATPVIFNGHPTMAYNFFREPPALRYAKNVQQIVTTDIKYLQVPNLVNTNENIILKNYLLEEIGHIKGNKNWNSTLTFKTIFENCNITGNNTQIKRKRDEIIKMLTYWKKEDHITDYEIIRKGRSYYGIKIVID